MENDRSEDAFFREGYLESYFLDTKGIAFKVGQQHFVSGESYILDGFSWQGRWAWTWTRRRSALGTLWKRDPGRGIEPLPSAQSGPSIHDLRKAQPVRGRLHDTEGFLADILRDVVARNPGSPGAGFTFQSSGDLLGRPVLPTR